MTQTQRLWPEPEQLHAYLDHWVTYINSLEQELAKVHETHRLQYTEHVTQINELQTRVTTQAQPYEHQIKELQQQLQHAQSQIAAFELERTQAIQRLALAIDVPPNARGVTLQSLVSQSIVLIEESKRMVQENL